MMQSYAGPVKAVILDWAGTTVDHGSLAPVRVLQEVFAGRGVPISEEEARRDMGVLKIDHIRKILFAPGVARDGARSSSVLRPKRMSRSCSRTSCRCSSNASSNIQS